VRYFEIKLYDSDYGGMKVVLSKSYYFHGYLSEAISSGEGHKSPWGKHYKLTKSEYPNSGTFKVREIPKEVIDARKALKKAEDKWENA
jgi:hypothetical protein